MDSCKRNFEKILYILIMISGFFVFILSIIQMSKDHGFKNIISVMGNFVINIEESSQNCDKYISDLKSSGCLAKAKTIFYFIFSFYQVIYTFLRLKNLDKSCRIGVLFYLILFFGHVVAIAMTSLIRGKYNFIDYYYFDYCFTTDNIDIIIKDESFKDGENNSNYMRKLDLAIISLNAISCGIMLFLGWMLLKSDCNSNNIIENEYFLDWTSIVDCIGNSDLRNNNNILIIIY